ncbi:zinc finger protein [Geoanaerobacter pelophilus]|uniref:Zinc finger protein n=1 Tax=Geoanaerobacter pelophilus TaxID=60036 RepID=A0ABQ0MJB1_9BACT|nr:zinc finger protein [Geoanaerobacter pelophilus]
MKKGETVLKIEIEKVKKKQVDLSEVEPASYFPALMEMEKAGECSFTAPVAAQVSAIWEYDHVRATGKVETAVKLTCSRCLAEYESPISSEFTIFYTEAKGDELDEEVELSDEELISASYTGDEIDLAPEIAEQVMLEVPYKPLCKESCLGLCPQCGADLNAGECGCDRGGINLKMAALKKIKIEK